LASDEVPFVQTHAKAEAGLVRILGRREIGAPVAIALLEPQRVDGLVPRGLDPERPAGAPQRVPDRARAPILDLELPAELAHVGHELRPDRRVSGVCGRAGEQCQGAGPAHVEIAERGEIEEPDTLADGAVLDTDAIEEGRLRPAPAALISARTATRRPGHEIVGALPAVL